MGKNLIIPLYLLLLFPFTAQALKVSISNVSDPSRNNQAHSGDVIRYRIDFETSAKDLGPYRLWFGGQPSDIAPFLTDTTTKNTVILYFQLETTQFPSNLPDLPGVNWLKLDVASDKGSITKVVEANFGLLLSDAKLTFTQKPWHITEPLKLNMPLFSFTRLPAKKDIRLYCNGMLFDSASCIGISPLNDTVSLYIKVESAAFAKQFYKNKDTRNLFFGLGNAQKELYSTDYALVVAFMKPFAKPWFWFIFAVIGIIMVGLAVKTDLIRDTAPDGVTKTYSLSRTQFAFWTFLVLNALIYILFTTKALAALPSDIFILLGISATVTAVSTLVEKNGENMTARKNCSGDGGKFLQFFTDILSDKGSISIHRLQNFLFTLFLGFYFWMQVMNTLAIPSFNANLLLLMGLSGAAYAAGKGLAGSNDGGKATDGGG